MKIWKKGNMEKWKFGKIQIWKIEIGKNGNLEK